MALAACCPCSPPFPTCSAAAFEARGWGCRCQEPSAPGRFPVLPSHAGEEEQEWVDGARGADGDGAVALLGASAAWPAPSQASSPAFPAPGLSHLPRRGKQPAAPEHAGAAQPGRAGVWGGSGAVPGRALTGADEEGGRFPPPGAGPVEAVGEQTALAGLHHLPPHWQGASPLGLGVAVADDGGAAVEILADVGGQLRPGAQVAGHGSPQPLPVQLHEARAAEIPVHQPQPGGSWRGTGEKASRYGPGRHFFPLLSRKSPCPRRLELNCPADAANAVNEPGNLARRGASLLCVPPTLPLRSPPPYPRPGRDGALTGGLRGGDRGRRWGLGGGFHRL